MAASARNTGTGRPWPQTLGLAFGAIYLIVGIVGFFVTGFDNFANNEQPDEALLFFAINPLHNIVHILIGAAGLALSRTLAGAKTFGLLLAVGYALAFIYGVIAIGEEWDILNINFADNILHIVSTIVGGAIYAGAKKLQDHGSRV